MITSKAWRDSSLRGRDPECEAKLASVGYFNYPREGAGLQINLEREGNETVEQFLLRLSGEEAVRLKDSLEQWFVHHPELCGDHARKNTSAEEVSADKKREFRTKTP